jgi:hypothetical protein
MIVHHAIDVKAAPDACWQKFVDLATWPSWFPLCKNARSLNGNPWQIGGRIEIVFHAGPVNVPVVVELEELEAAKDGEPSLGQTPRGRGASREAVPSGLPVYKVRWKGGRLGLSGNHSYTFSVNSPGLTRVTSHEEFSGVATRWIPRRVMDRIDGEVHRSMERFKSLVEQ